ncbi:hypothetical protein XU18_1607 [Perkinsela sp. CCAP 1560/4]|nr:hypothetical protein XU18_1607 [Perkinsela sp. CCAP 1560/4]|eukprot:KNH07716.1 hypothetical protein XU18_1607 [Perkinsela sp. CCAP 1560/4]
MNLLPSKPSPRVYPSQLYAVGYIIIALTFALYQPILDCDETFNYWEPLHYLFFGCGLQTWEYHPDFALRSWLYIKLHKILLLPVAVFRGKIHKSVYFYALKCILGMITALTASRFRTAVGYRFGQSIGTNAGLIILGGVGIHSAGVSFLPSSFSMVALFLSLSEWLRLGLDRCPDQSDSTRVWFRIIAYTAASFFLGWPFALPSALAYAIHCLLHDTTHICLRFAAGVTLLILSVSTVVDSISYGRLTLPVFNLLRYNLMPTEHAGSHLYGTEPVSYMLRNLILCFNLIFPIALFFPVSLCLQPYIANPPKPRDAWAYTATLWVLLGAWSCVPHKEERFFSQMYPFIVLSAAVTIETGHQFCCRIFSQTAASILYKVFFALYFCISIARSLALFTLYSAPRELHDAFRRTMPMHDDTEANQRTICYSKDWYRFPSSFFLPSDSERVRVAFVKSDGLDAQLPVPFRTTQSRDNDLNQSNVANSMQFTSVSQCDYLMTSHGNEVDRKNWTKSYQRSIVNAPTAPWYFRAFYLPYVSRHKLSFASFCLYSKHVESESRP